RSATCPQCPGGCVHPRQLEGISVAGQPAGGSGYPVLPPSAGDRGRYRSGSGSQESGGQPGPGTDAAAPVAADQLAGSGGQGAGTGGTGTAGPGLGRPGKVTTSSIRWLGSGCWTSRCASFPGVSLLRASDCPRSYIILNSAVIPTISTSQPLTTQRSQA